MLFLQKDNAAAVTIDFETAKNPHSQRSSHGQRHVVYKHKKLEIDVETVRGVVVGQSA